MKNKLVLIGGAFALIIFLGTNSRAFAQAGQTAKDPSSNASNEPVFTVVEKQPEYPEGDAARSRFFAENLNIPKTAKKDRRVFLSFVVNTDGSLQDIAIKKGHSPEIDAEVLRVAKMMPNWKPGSQAGRPVRVQYYLPVQF